MQGANILNVNSRGLKRELLCGVALIGFTILYCITPAGAVAQTATAGNAAGAAEQIEEVTVTATRVNRAGYSAPTPVTELSANDIAASGVANVADYVNEMPSVAADSSPRTATINVSSGSAGSNFLDLRGLGPNRTLVLLDGRRVVGGNTQGNVDANTLPTALISRVDIVTGGASADWGSDAVAGVVNFILDTNFSGLKASVQAGETTYGDDFKWKADVAAGGSFGDGKGHIVVSGSYSKANGAFVGSRSWFHSQKIIPNPSYAPGNGQPKLILASNVSVNSATPGGLILSGALKGTEFLSGGATRQFNFGTTSGLYSLNGTPNDPAAAAQLDIPLEQVSLFAHVSYDVSNTFRPYVEASYSKALVNSQDIYNFNFGNLTIQRDNAYLPPAMAATLTAAGQTNFKYGILPVDLGRINPQNDRTVTRFVVGADGAIFGDWTYSAYGQYGRSDIDVDVHNLEIPANFALATDVVRNSRGEIVCRVNQVTVTNPNCVPYNLFGFNVGNSAAARNFVSGTSSLHQILEEKVVSATIQGDPFSTWAGQVSVAAGGEYRSERVTSSVDTLSLESAFLAGNYNPTIGSYDVYEGFVETVVPILRGLPLAQEIDFNGADRETHYSTSGDVNTWKLGLNWDVNSDIRFRTTYSTDIRAPNLNDLFQGGVSHAGKTVNDPVTGTQTTGITEVSVGNTKLRPEIAHDFTAGVVFQPDFISGLNLSIDYYRISIHQAITSLTDQQVVDECNSGNGSFCSFITRNGAGAITNIILAPFNAALQIERGWDIDATYSRPVDDFISNIPGDVTLHVLANHTISNSINAAGTSIQLAGESGTVLSNTVPKWKVWSSISYDNDQFGASLVARSVSGGVYDTSYTSATIANNHIPGATYWDMEFRYRPETWGSPELFLNIDNMFDRDPVIVAPTAQQMFNLPVNAALYDVLGRTITVGIKIRL